MSRSDVFNRLRMAPMAAVVLSVLAGCAGSYSRNSDMLPGPETFTFAGNLPKNFGITAQANYHAVEPKNCQVYDISLQREVTRNFGRDWIARISNQQQRFGFAIPLTYKSGLCEMSFSGMDLEIDAKYGEQAWQTSYGKGGFIVVKSLPKEARVFDHKGKLEIASECSWLFQTSNASSRWGEIEKLARCTGAGAYLQRDQLANKNVQLTVVLSPEEKPSHRGTWVKFPEGWKPCLGRGPNDPYGFCYNSPEVFKDFKMNGETCAIYPGCTEGTGS